jgi:hypothetical protein
VREVEKPRSKFHKKEICEIVVVIAQSVLA